MTWPDVRDNPVYLKKRVEPATALKTVADEKVPDRDLG